MRKNQTSKARHLDRGLAPGSRAKRGRKPKESEGLLEGLVVVFFLLGSRRRRSISLRRRGFGGGSQRREIKEREREQWLYTDQEGGFGFMYTSKREREARGPIRTGSGPAGLASSLGLFILKGKQAAFTSLEEERKERRKKGKKRWNRRFKTLKDENAHSLVLFPFESLSSTNHK